MPSHPLDPFVADRFAALDWEDVAAVRDIAEPFLADLAADTDLLTASMRYAMTDSALFARSESDHFFDRAVLFEDYGRGCSIRLQRLQREEHHRPHNHRATFSARLLSGSYEHRIYLTTIDIDGRSNDPPLSKEELEAFVIGFESLHSAGSAYTLHHTTIHSTIATEDHLSLLVRGHSAKDKLFFVDEERGDPYWHYGGRFEDPSDVEARQMTSERMEALIGRVLELDLVPTD
jgi:hypothetical protein